MFFRRSFFFILFGLLLVVGLFGLRQQSNFAQGYSAGWAAAQQETAEEGGEAAASPAGPSQAYPHGHGWGFFPIFGFFGFFGFLLKFWLMLMIFGFFMKMLGFGRHRHWPKGHWRRGDGRPYEKQPEDVEPDIRHA